MLRPNVHIINHAGRFASRRVAGEILATHVAAHVRAHNLENIVVLGLPKGGIVVAAPIAHALGVPLDFVVTRKLFAPHQPQLAIGAITDPGRAFLNKPVIDALGITDAYIEEEIEREKQEIQMATAAYRSVLPSTSLVGKTVIVADDNVITGSTMFATLRGLWAERPNNIVLAIPIAPRDTLISLSEFADSMIALQAPANSFSSMVDYYDEYEPVTDQDVMAILHQFVAEMAF
ncbi:MAG: phosphoribosyltransferase family protein [Chloroflexi bacterium]|nr:phosphoribosyltransferase family protein [Chloroflexota bacterium]